MNNESVTLMLDIGYLLRNSLLIENLDEILLRMFDPLSSPKSVNQSPFYRSSNKSRIQSNFSLKRRSIIHLQHQISAPNRLIHHSSIWVTRPAETNTKLCRRVSADPRIRAADKAAAEQVGFVRCQNLLTCNSAALVLRPLTSLYLVSHSCIHGCS